MLKLIVGLKGSGKTKQLISLVNTAAEQTKGAVVCIEKGTKLLHEITYQVRLIDTDEYLINGGRNLFGAVSGIFASNHDITDIFIDSALKICKNDIAEFEHFVLKTKELCDKQDLKITMTASIAAEDLPASLQEFIA